MIDTILCFDNQRNGEISVKPDQAKILEKFKGLNHKKLREEYKIHLLGDVEETDKKECLFSLSEHFLSTSNLMGVVNLSDGNKTVRLVIGSRFDKKPKTDENGQIKKNGNEVEYELDPEQPFFRHMLEKVYQCDFTMDAEGSSHTLWDILLAIRFRVLLEQAANIGVLRLYQTIHHNDLRFRGKLDINRHILKNSLIKDKIAYDTHEHTADNPINHLILYAEKYVRRKYPDVLSASQEAEDLLKQLKTEVPSFGSKSVQTVIGDKDNLKTLRHPYYAEYYEELRRISLALLREEGANVFDDKEEDALNGIIISGAWLWEEYVFSLMKEKGFIHAVRSRSEHPIYRFKNGDEKGKSPLYPDFRLPIKEPKEEREQKASIVFDAKYKRDNTIVRNDMAQIFSYMLLTGAKTVGFIYPPQPDKEYPSDKDGKTLSDDMDGTVESEEQEAKEIARKNAKEAEKEYDENRDFHGVKIYQSMTGTDHFYRSYTFLKRDEKEDVDAWQDRMEKDFKDFLDQVIIFSKRKNS